MTDETIRKIEEWIRVRYGLDSRLVIDSYDTADDLADGNAVLLSEAIEAILRLTISQ